MMGVFDLTKGTVVNGMNKADVTIWNDLMFFELASGSVRVAKVNYDPVDKHFKSTDIGNSRDSGWFDATSLRGQRF